MNNYPIQGNNITASFQNLDVSPEVPISQQKMPSAYQLFGQLTKQAPMSCNFLLEKQKAKYYVIKVTNISPEVKHKSLFNLFSLYGNIEKISLDETNNTAFVFYLTEFEQVTALHCLPDMPLFGRSIQLEAVQKNQLPAKVRSLLKNSDQNSGELPNTVCYRKNKETGSPSDITAKLRVINKPSKTLYIFNLTKSVTLDIIRSLFDSFSKVEDIYYLNESKNSALAFFDSIEAAVRVLCLLKNTNLIDKSLKINFANDNMMKMNTNKAPSRPKFTSLQNFEIKKKTFGTEKLIDPLQNMKKETGSNFKLFSRNNFEDF